MEIYFLATWNGYKGRWTLRASFLLQSFESWWHIQRSKEVPDSVGRWQKSREFAPLSQCTCSMHPGYTYNLCFLCCYIWRGLNLMFINSSKNVTSEFLAFLDFLAQINANNAMQTILSDRSRWDLSNKPKFIEIGPCVQILCPKNPSKIGFWIISWNVKLGHKTACNAKSKQNRGLEMILINSSGYFTVNKFFEISKCPS